MKISIIIPVWNEERRISSCLDALVPLTRSKEIFEIVVSADGCTDRTVEIVQRYSKKYPFIKLISFEERLGKGGGIINATKIAEGDAYLLSDVDLSVPSEEFSHLINTYLKTRADLVYGSRYLPNSKFIRKPPMLRILFGRGLNILFRILFRSNIRDTQCGFKIIKKEVIKKLGNEIYIKGFAFDLNLTIQSLKHGFTIVEVPIRWDYKEGSRLNIIKQPLFMGRDLILLWFRTWF